MDDKLEKAQNGEVELRDQDGNAFIVDTYDDTGAYIHTPEPNSDSHRITRGRLKEEFEFVNAMGEVLD